jgi:hypothetical protein
MWTFLVRHHHHHHHYHHHHPLLHTYQITAFLIAVMTHPIALQDSFSHKDFVNKIL